MTVQGRSTKRPPRWLRIVAAAVTALYGVLLIPDHSPQDVLKTAVLAPLFLLVAIAPHGLFDGRFNAWTRRHLILTSGIMFVVFGTYCLSGLATLLDWWLAVAITLPVTAIVVAVGAFYSRRARGSMSNPGDS
jgi:hypothetical protein